MRNVRVLAIVAAMAAAVAVPAGTAGAATAPVRCGDTITTSVVLTTNLTCPGNGLVVGADGLTIDLDGHRLTGSGVGVGIETASDVTVINGTIRRFDVGINSWTDVQLRGVKIAQNRVGWTSRGGGGEVSGATFVSNGAGLIAGAGPVTVTGSTFRANGTGASCGDADLVVTGSRFADNQTGIDGSVCGTRIEGSTFVGGDVGLRLRNQGYGMQVRGNTFARAGIGMSLTGVGDATHTIVGNVFTNNLAAGLLVDVTDTGPGYPVSITQNTFTRNGYAPGSLLDPTGHPLTSGVWADAGTFTGNTARANAGHGIEGYAVTDGGGNTARSNRTEPQCVGVVCTAR